MRLLELVLSHLGCGQHQHRPRLRGFELNLPDEPIEKDDSMTITKPIAPGYRRKIAIVADWPLDVRVDGQYLGATVVDGDSSAPTIADSSPKGGTIWINGDGSAGVKNVQILADGHVGDGDIGVTLDIQYTVASPDATALTGSEVGADEPIPGVTPPVV